MPNARVTGVRSIELGVRDLDESLKFYTEIWGLERAGGEGDTVHLRATGGEHHVLTLRERGKADLLALHFAAADGAAVTQLCAQAKGFGAPVEGEPAALPASAGGGFGFRLKTPEGLPLSISSDVARHGDTFVDRSRPSKISHVVLNSARTEEQTAFFVDVLGFKLSDSSRLMDFLRCHADHHSVAMFRNIGPSLNHVAYEVPNIDGLMRGAGRCKESGFEIEWGVGRHGPGNNVFSYFIEPNGFVTEYTTELDQIDEATHIPRDAAYWDAMPFKGDRWGLAGQPSNRMQAAMSGAMYQAERCEDVIGRKLG
jgi:catechol 2,3-dioxygenase-like lactoylglutathione lyase family enzyme